MISPHTPPGTKVIALRTGENIFTNDGSSRPPRLDEQVIEGLTYTVSSICTDDACAPGPYQDFWVTLEEVYQTAAPLYYFRYAELPKCLTEILDTQPVEPISVGELVEGFCNF